MKKIAFILGLCCAFFCFTPLLFAQKVEQVEKIQSDLRQEKELREKIEKPKPEPEVQKEAPEPLAPAVSQEKVKLEKINVTAVTLLSEKEVSVIVSSYQGKELTLGEMQKIADQITDAYRKKGYITSRAYLPPQKIEGGILEIRAVEGITGNFQIKGNRYFKTALLRNKIKLKTGQPFNYDILRKGLTKINEMPDRSVKTVLAPGKEPGTTDVVLEAHDRLPLHVGLNWDNYGSRYINKDRYRTSITHNNLLGCDDVFTFQYQISEAEAYRLFSLRYLFPLVENWKLGFFAAKSRVKLGQDYEDLTARGKSSFYTLYLSDHLIDEENLDATFNLAFDYKDVFNFQSNLETSRDRLRVLKLGLDLDFSDNSGRTFVNNEFSYGIPDIMGGLSSKDSHASRNGAGGEFFKHNLDILRLQRMPFNSNILWKNQLQFSPYILPATEQYQIGGIINVRGYPPAEVVGDRGYSMTWEWSFPAYGLSKNIKVPFSKAKLYDALRFVAFYDWANTYLRRPGATEEKNKTLRGAGCGIRFNLPEDFSFRVEFAWPLDNTPSDSDHLHTLFDISKSF